MSFRAVCNTAISPWKQPAKFNIWKCTVYKVICVYSYCLSKERVDSESLKQVFFKTNPKQFHVHMYACWSFCVIWIKMQIHSLPQGATFEAVKIYRVSLVMLYTKQHCAYKRSLIRHYMRDERIMRGGVWKNEAEKWIFSENCSIFLPCMHVNLLLETPKTKIWTKVKVKSSTSLCRHP